MQEVKLFVMKDEGKAPWCCPACGLQRIGVQGKVTRFVLPCKCGHKDTIEPPNETCA